MIFAIAERQSWDKKQEDEARVVKPDADENTELPPNHILRFRPFGTKGSLDLEKQGDKMNF